MDKVEWNVNVDVDIDPKEFLGRLSEIEPMKLVFQGLFAQKGVHA